MWQKELGAKAQRLITTPHTKKLGNSSKLFLLFFVLISVWEFPTEVPLGPSGVHGRPWTRCGPVLLSPSQSLPSQMEDKQYL